MREKKKNMSFENLLFSFSQSSNTEIREASLDECARDNEVRKKKKIGYYSDINFYSLDTIS